MTNELKKQFRMVFEKISDPLLLVDPSGYILDFNPAARRTFDIGDTEHITDVVSLEKSFVFDVTEMLQLLARSDSVHGVRLNDDEGNPSDVVADVLRLDAQTTKKSAKLIHIKDFSTLGNYERWKDELISMVAHEIKNPLSAMKNSMSILVSQATGPVTDDQNRLLTTSIRGIDRLTRLLDGFLDMSRIGAGQFTFEPRWVNAHEFLPDVIDSFTTLFNVQRQTLACSLSDEIGKVFVDAPKLEQILINLLSNAVKFTPGGGEIKVTLEPASLEAMRDDLRILNWREIADLRFVHIGVRDTGIGMTGETVSHLFTRYYQKGDGGGLRGSHLGLSISKTLTEAQYGSLHVESEPGVGTEATVYLPEDESTVLVLSRIASMERCLSRIVDARKQSVFGLFRKGDTGSWATLFERWPERPAINPTPEMEKGLSLVAWTLGDRYLAFCSLDTRPAKLMPEGVTPPVHGHAGDTDWAVGFCEVPEDGSTVAQLLKIALNRLNPSPIRSNV